MAQGNRLEYWEVWYPRAAATGLLVARGLMEPAQAVILHAPPEVLTVAVYDEDANRLAYGQDLPKTEQSPMCLLRREGRTIGRRDFWPTQADVGRPVLLPGGEVGILLSWWNADDRKEWRWQIEFYNSIR